MKQKKETVGKLAVELAQKADDKHSIGEQMQEQLSNYDTELFLCFERNKQKYKGIFYIVVITRGDKLLKNVIRHQFFARNSAPTPEYDQCVYQCHKEWPEPRFMWVMPCKDYSEYMFNNKESISPTEYQLLQFVIDFYDGTLLKLVKHLNHETEDTGQLILENN